jgi:hypothetical protein
MAKMLEWMERQREKEKKAEIEMKIITQKKKLAVKSVTEEHK